MMGKELSANSFASSISFYSNEFELLLSKIISCYQLMIDDCVILTNNENLIRDKLYLNYLNDDIIRKRIGLISYFFDREVPEDSTKGRTDIRVLTLNSFKDTKAYWIVECKRIDATNTCGTTGLNAKYVENGICRFTSVYYSIYNRANGMIGFVVEPMDINKNVSSINKLIATNYSKTNTTQELQYKELVRGFEFSYYSRHYVKENSVVLYHLMFDFSKNIVL